MSLRRTNTIRGSSESLSLIPEGNFWDTGNYKPVLKRISNGPKLCDELVKMMQERANLEKHFAKELSAFAERWEDKLHSRVPEYGTLQDGWLSVTAEARSLADIHMACKTAIDDVMKPRIEAWKKEHYKRSLLHLKSYKRASAAFEKAQSPWAKRKDKIDKHRNNAAKYAAQAEQLRAHPDAGVSSKVKDSISKALSNEKQSQEKLRLRVEEMISYTDIYRREMSLEFERCQAEEKERIEFFKDALLQFHKLMDTSQAVQDAHAHSLARLQQVAAERDLDQFSRDFGTGMPMLIPDSDGTWYLEGTTPPSQGGQGYQASQHQQQQQQANHDHPQQAAQAPQQQQQQHMGSHLSQGVTVSTPDDIRQMPAGTALIALYDYDGNHDDELSFKANDIITLDSATECEAGWLRGTHTTSGKLGIFPGNYVAVSS